MMKSSPRQAFFSTFSRKALAEVRDIPNAPKIMVTGSLVRLHFLPLSLQRLTRCNAIQRTQELLATTVRSSHAELLGIGRASIPSPSLARDLTDTSPSALASSEPKPTMVYASTLQPPEPWWSKHIQLVGATVASAWWMSILQRQAQSGRRTGAAVKISHIPNLAKISGHRAVIELMFGLERTRWIVGAWWTIVAVGIAAAAKLLLI